MAPASVRLADAPRPLRGHPAAAPARIEVHAKPVFVREPQRRDELFRRLSGLGRVKIALFEHDLDLLSARSCRERVEVVWDYYRSQFEAVHRLQCSGEDKHVLCNWLAIQVRDRLNDQQGVICMKHTESSEGWSARLTAAGFAHDPVPVERDLGGTPGQGISLYSFQDAFPPREHRYRFFIVAKNCPG